MASTMARWCIQGFLTGMVALTATAQEFRVETDVFSGNAKEPVSESLTIFSGELVYDFLLGDSEEIAVFDVKRGRIMLLDARSRSKTEFTTENLLEFATAIQSRGAGPAYEPLFHPQFTTTFDEERSLLRLESERLTYSAKCIAPKQPNAAKRFQQFADWYARLNAIRPGNIPPFGRLELNRALAERNLIPEEIERTLIIDKKQIARSHHAVTWIVSFSDRKRMENADSLIASLETVPPKEFWKVAKAGKSAR